MDAGRDVTELRYARRFALLGLAVALAAVGIGTAVRLGKGAAPPQGWVTLFEETFTTTSPIWQMGDTTWGLYRWGVTPYTRPTGTTDHGLWAAGGGTLGSQQRWPTGTYVNDMRTWAIAGPITLPRSVWDVRLYLSLDNRLGAGDTLFVGLSDDGEHFQGITLTEGTSTFVLNWLAWSSRAFSRSTTMWIGLIFESDAQGVATGPLVDDLRLEANVGHRLYLPIIRRAPTPTITPSPTPSPTPTPAPTSTPLPLFVDDFEDPASGWYSGTAERLNYLNGIYVTETVAYLSYDQGHYRNYIPLTRHGGGDVDTWFVWPAQFAPLPNSYTPLPDRFCIEVRGMFANSQGNYDPWWAHWGIIFGADEPGKHLFTFQINANGRWALLEYINYIYPGNRQPIDGTPENIEQCLLEDGCWNVEMGDVIWMGPVYNTLKVVVRNEWLSLYVNGRHLQNIAIHGVPRDRIGVIGGSIEVTPVEIWWDDFRYDPFCPEAQP